MSVDQRLKWIRELRRRPGQSDGDLDVAPPSKRWDFPAFVDSIASFNASQPNAGMLDDIRAYNHFIMSEFNRIGSLRGTTILDIGASPHCYAMEKCFELGVSRYVGIGLDIGPDESVLVGDGEGHLLHMNAEDLAFPDCSFDCVVSMSTFEHIGDVPRALGEIERVLKPEGRALISFEPLWSCAYGHHLHHLGEVARSVPPWAHLVWSRERMRAQLAAELAKGSTAHGVDELLSLMFDDTFINRMGIERMREAFRQGSMNIEWMVPMMHERIDDPILAEAERVTGLSADDLHTKGLSVLLNKRAAGIQ